MLRHFVCIIITSNYQYRQFTASVHTKKIEEMNNNFRKPMLTGAMDGGFTVYEQPCQVRL